MNKQNHKEEKDGFSPKRNHKPIILDDNELSIMKYAEEYPENWEKVKKQNHKPEVTELNDNSGSPSGEKPLSEKMFWLRDYDLEKMSIKFKNEKLEEMIKGVLKNE